MTDETPRAKFERLKAEVLTLTAKQRREIVTLLGGASSSPCATPATLDESQAMNESLFYGAVIESMRRVGAIDSAPPMSVVWGTCSNDIKRSAEAFARLVGKHSGRDTMSRVQVTVSYMFLGEVVLIYMRSNATPVSVRSVMSQCVNVWSAFDAQFPGYIAAGLSGVVFDRVLQPPQ